MKKVLTIAGSDCSGGAGIQADLKTMTSLGVYGMSAVTALTAQNTTGVYGVMESTPDFLKSQLDCIFEDIYPDAIKIGMVSGCELIEVIAERLEFYHASRIVLDPVMVSTSKSRLISEDAVDLLSKRLMPLADLITPNIPEAQVLSRMSISSKEEMEEAGKKISKIYHKAVLVKGGHQVEDADDVLCFDDRVTWFLGRRISNPNTHGTGCTLSSAIACGLAAGLSMEQSISKAKAYLTSALMSGLDLGSGNGPLNHCFGLEDRF